MKFKWVEKVAIRLVIVGILVAISLKLFSEKKNEENGEDEVTPAIYSSDITIHGLELNQIVEEIIKKAHLPKGFKEFPLITWLVDNTSLITQHKCLETLGTSISKLSSKYPGLKMALVRFSRNNSALLCPPTNNISDIIKNLNAMKPDDSSKDFCQAIRDTVELIKSYPHKKYLVIFTLENNELESDLEGTLELLNEHKITLMVISTGAILSNPNETIYKEKPEGSELRRYDSAEIELVFHNPYLDWWWPMGREAGDDTYLTHKFPYYNTYVFSGYGFYGLSRLAAYSGGRYYIWYPPNMKSPSFCEIHKCRWCSSNKKGHTGDLGCSTSYTKLLPGMSPVLVSRGEYLGYKNELLHLFKTKGNFWPNTNLKTLVDDKGNILPEAFADIDRKIKELDELIKTVTEGLAQTKNLDKRFEAHIAVSLANLYVERFGLHQYKYYLKTKAPKLERPKEGLYGYIRPLFECLCHLEVEPESEPATTYPEKDGYIKKIDHNLPPKLQAKINQFIKLFKSQGGEIYGGEEGEKELAKALGKVAQEIIRYKNTPWELVLRRLPVIINFQIELFPDYTGGVQPTPKPPTPQPSGPPKPGPTGPSGPRPTPTK